jgi:uracil-DNA glycosylase family 4
MLAIEQLVSQVKACSICKAHLPSGVRPIIQLSSEAKILIAGQAPGAAADRKGIPFDDASGERLRQWLGVSREQFYDADNFAILPMAFCYPGRGKSGDLPPRKECAQRWRIALLSQMSKIELTIAIGQYAQDYHLQDKKSVTERVQNWRRYGEHILPLPHPSPRNNIWLKRHPWFEQTLLPELQRRVAMILDNDSLRF